MGTPPHSHVRIESRTHSNPYEWEDYLVNLHPTSAFTIKYRMFYEGMGGGERVENCVLEPLEERYLDGVDHGPSPTQYIKTEILAVSPALYSS